MSQSTTLPSCSNGKAVGWNAKGIQGPPGLEGKQGPPGLEGKQGPNGRDGASAYDLYVADYKAKNPGATGGWKSLIDWINSLQGTNGTNGTNGANGRNGVAGASAVASSGTLATSGSRRGVFTGDSKVASAYAFCASGQVPLSGGFDIDPAQMTNAQWPQVIASVPVQDATYGWGWKVTLAAPSGNSALAALTFDATVVCVNNS